MHPREDISGDRARQQRRPDSHVKRVEPRGRGGRRAERSDPQRVHDEDQRGAAGGAAQARPPADRIREDRSEAHSKGICAAARQRHRDGQRRDAEQPGSASRLHAGQRQQDVGLGPVQTNQTEETEAPHDASERELNRVRLAADNVRRHAGSPAR